MESSVNLEETFAQEDFADEGSEPVVFGGGFFDDGLGGEEVCRAQFPGGGIPEEVGSEGPGKTTIFAYQ